MKRKVFSFCLVFLFFGLMPAFSQLNQVGNQRLRCTEAIGANGQAFTSNVSYVYLYQYDDGSYQFQIYYRDSTPTEYMYFRNGRNFSTGMQYDVSITIGANDQRVAGLTGLVVGNSSMIFVTVYRGSDRLFQLTLRE